MSFRVLARSVISQNRNQADSLGGVPILPSSLANPVTLAGLTIALLLPIPPYREPFLHLLMARFGMSWMSAWELVGVISKLAVIIGIPLLVVRWEHRRLTSIGIRTPSAMDFLGAILVFVIYLLMSPHLRRFADAVPAMSAELTLGATLYATLPKWLDWTGLVANSIAEEVGFRGYSIERIEEMTGSTAVAAAFPLVVNTLVHAPIWGIHGMLIKAPILLLLVVLYLWRRSLFGCVIAHLLIDMRAFEF